MGSSRSIIYAGDQRIAMKDGGANRILLGDHLGSTAYTISGASETGELRYKAFGATRFTSGTTPTTFRYTGQREESALGLYYYGARWYDPALGHFIQPDTLVPQPGNVLDYHHYSYTRFNPLKYNDPTGHSGCAVTVAPMMLQDPGWCSGGIGGIILVALVQAANTGAPMVAQWGDKAYAMADGVYQMAQQAAHHSASQSNAGNSATDEPNGWDPNKLNHIFKDAGERYQYQTSGTLYGQEKRLHVNVNGVQRTLDVDNIVNGYLRESKFVNEATSFYSKQIGGSTGMRLHVGGWQDELQRYGLAAEQHGYKGVKLFSNSQEALRVARELFGQEEWSRKIELIYQVAK